jgi:GNAT superfamily N-acetyltransferase
MMGASTIGLRILPTTDVDLPSTVDVLNAAFGIYEFLEESRTSLDSIGDELHDGCRFLQVFEGDELVGTACVTPGATAGIDPVEFPGIDLPSSLYFGLVGVRPDRMGGGIGRRLCEAAERIARAEGFQRIILTTIEEMGNVAYYGRLGYQSVYVKDLPVGYWSLTKPVHYHGMVKELGPAIREAQEADVEAIAELVNLAYVVEDFFKVGPRTDAEEIATIVERRRFFLVEDGGRAAACAYLGIEDGRGHFGMLSVHPDAQGRGLARRLITHMERFCVERGCTHLDLEYVNLREELPAFYRRFGFEITGEAPWPAAELHRISRPAHFVTMSKPLPRLGNGP